MLTASSSETGTRKWRTKRKRMYDWINTSRRTRKIIMRTIVMTERTRTEEQGQSKLQTKISPLYRVEIFEIKANFLHPANTDHLYNVGPTSLTLVQHNTNVIQMFCVNWDALLVRYELYLNNQKPRLSSKSGHKITRSPIRREYFQQTQDIEPMLFRCWASVADGGTTLKQH